MSSVERFPFVHPSIAEILDCPCDNPRNLIEPRTLRIMYESSKDMIDLQSLVELAHASDKVLFEADTAIKFRAPLQGLLSFCQENEAAATLLALNSLESAIRRATGHATGKAPLLKIMLQQLQEEQLAPILKSLLLPHEGLNLRNLLWHGFLPSLPRPWFSLVMVLVYNLEQRQEDPSEESLPVLPDLRSQVSLQLFLEDSIDDSDVVLMRAWLPASHRCLFDLSMKWCGLYPACAAALLGILLEHGLRVEWCRVNNRPHDRIAQPGAYYVTLDGHGQRNQHDLILHPYQQQQRNALASHLGGGTVALLTDLFASSCGGPNIRAALAHGTWDIFIDKELCCMITGSAPDVDVRLQDMVQLMLVAFKSVATKSSLQYKPLFSYTATTTRNLDTTLGSLERLESLRNSPDHRPTFAQAAIETSDALMQLCISTDRLRKSVVRLPLALSHNEWTIDNIFEEYESNVGLADCIAASILLSDVADATASYVALLEGALEDLKGDSLSSRQHRRAMRICSMVDATMSLYSFVTRVALLFIEYKVLGKSRLAPKVLLKAVERSRMCVSTFATFLPTNAERAIKSAVDFTKGKATRSILEETQEEVKVRSVE